MPHRISASADQMTARAVVEPPRPIAMQAASAGPHSTSTAVAAAASLERMIVRRGTGVAARCRIEPSSRSSPMLEAPSTSETIATAVDRNSVSASEA